MTSIRMGLLAAVLAGACSAAPAAAAGDSQRTITVGGSASVTVANDTAGFLTGIVVRRSSPGEALRSASAAMSRILGALERGGVALRDLRTSDVSVRRERRHHRVAYVAANTVAVTVRQVTRTGAVIDAAIRAGATTMSGLHFWRSRSADVYRQALVAALRDARAKAQALAQEAGATLGAVVSIDESGVDAFPLDSASAKAPAPTAPTRPGRTRVTAQLSAVFAIG